MTIIFSNYNYAKLWENREIYRSRRADKLHLDDERRRREYFLTSY